MTAQKQLVSIFIILGLLLNISISIPNVSAPPAPIPNQFIAEIFPNSTLQLRLIDTNTILTLDAVDFPNKINMKFDANYTIHNPGDYTIIPVIVPFSLAVNYSQLTIEVHENDTQIPYDLFLASPWNARIIEINVSLFTRFVDMYPIIFIRNNISLPKNSNSTLRYQINGSISNPIDLRDLFYFIYHVGTSQRWFGNTTRDLEIKTYGKQPIINRGGSAVSLKLEYGDLIDINGGKFYRWEWNNNQNFEGDFGVKYYKAVENGSRFIIIINISVYIAVAIIITLYLIIRKNRKKLDPNIFSNAQLND